MDVLNVVEIIEVAENFIDRNRPAEDIRDEVDLAYRIDNQSLIIYELRPAWNNPGELLECNIAKATFSKNKNIWKVFWQRADLKWHSYKPNPSVENLRDFVRLVEEDQHGCFWG